MYLASRYWK